LKRNRMSGFDVKFTDHHQNDGLPSTPERQEELKNEFFISLNAFAKSNVSLALIYWLLSTQEIDEHTITIGKFKNPDINFLGSLSNDKIFVLMALVLHDGLSVCQIAQVLNIKEARSREAVQVLQKDGIVTYSNDFFNVNPIVYRSTIGLLKSKNLIH